MNNNMTTLRSVRRNEEAIEVILRNRADIVPEQVTPLVAQYIIRYLCSAGTGTGFAFTSIAITTIIVAGGSVVYAQLSLSLGIIIVIIRTVVATAFIIIITKHRRCSGAGGSTVRCALAVFNERDGPGALREAHLDLVGRHVERADGG